MGEGSGFLVSRVELWSLHAPILLLQQLTPDGILKQADAQIVVLAAIHASMVIAFPEVLHVHSPVATQATKVVLHSALS